MNAFEEIVGDLEEGEVVEAIVFGEWGGRDHLKETFRLGIPISLEEAKPFLETFSTQSGGHGLPDTFALYVWTSKSVGFIGDYDGATSLRWVPRHPCACVPEMV